MQMSIDAVRGKGGGVEFVNFVAALMLIWAYMLPNETVPCIQATDDESIFQWATSTIQTQTFGIRSESSDELSLV